MSINKVNGFDVLTCTNSCDTPPATHGKELKTTKNDKGFHGLGVKSINRLVCLYNGSFEWSYEKDKREFSAFIIFNQGN